ncbi:MAG: hypothetical protein ABWK01_04635 [Infirmifilum sp.]
MVSLTVLRAIKLTPSLVARFALLPVRKVRNPCLYCPGICLASCPTFLESGSMLLSPLGYSRNPVLGLEKCAKCWRCVQECPLEFPLPETYTRSSTRVYMKTVKEGSPLLVAVEGLDVEYAEQLAEKLKAGVAVVSGLEARYIGGQRLEPKSAKKVSNFLAGRDAYALSPEASHALGIEFLPEVLPRLGFKVKYEGPVHIPCLLRRREQSILDSLASAGARITSVDRDSCLKVKPRGGVLYLCPRARFLGVKNLYDIL